MTDSNASLWHLVPDHPVGRAVVLPGGSGYTIDHPLLWWTCQVLAENGWLVTAVRWEIDEAARADPVAFVGQVAQQALDLAGPADRKLIVGKSFGTFAAPWAAEQGWPGVWLTPVLSETSATGRDRSTASVARSRRSRPSRLNCTDRSSTQVRGASGRLR